MIQPSEDIKNQGSGPEHAENANPVIEEAYI